MEKNKPRYFYIGNIDFTWSCHLFFKSKSYRIKSKKIKATTTPINFRANFNIVKKFKEKLVLRSKLYINNLHFGSRKRNISSQEQ